jgi:hypothetical protein
MNPNPFHRFNPAQARYPSGPGLAAFEFGDFTEIKALLFELGLGQELPSWLTTAKSAATRIPAEKECSTCFPVRSPRLPANDFGAHAAIGILFIFINRRIDIDGCMVICLPTPGREVDAAAICAQMAASFFANVPGGGGLHLEFIEQLKGGN